MPAFAHTIHQHHSATPAAAATRVKLAAARGPDRLARRDEGHRAAAGHSVSKGGNMLSVCEGRGAMVLIVIAAVSGMPPSAGWSLTPRTNGHHRRCGNTSRRANNMGDHEPTELLHTLAGPSSAASAPLRPASTPFAANWRARA